MAIVIVRVACFGSPAMPNGCCLAFGRVEPSGGMLFVAVGVHGARGDE